MDSETRRLLKEVFDRRARQRLQQEGRARLPGDPTDDELEAARAAPWIQTFAIPRRRTSADSMERSYEGTWV